MLYTQAGPEIAVASTKAFLTQIVAVYLVALYLAQVRGNKFGDEIGRDRRTSWPTMPQKVDLVLDTVEGVRELARDVRRRAARCCSSVGTSATRSRSRAR